MTEPIFLDTETCGLCGPWVLLQYAVGGGEIQLYNQWYETVDSTIKLTEWIANHPGGIVGFNLAFDWFQLFKNWTILKMLQDAGKGDEILIDVIDEYAEFEPRARDYPLCLKPVTALDLMLHARKGPYQSTMDRGDIRIRRVPTVLAWNLAKELEKRVKLKKIYFARRADQDAPQWSVHDCKNMDGEDVPEFKDVVLSFAPSTALKALAVDALGVEEDKILLFRDIEVSRKFWPVEYGYAPFAKAVGNRWNWKGAWPEVIRYHIAHWQTDSYARDYATKDIVYTRGLYEHFDRPSMGDDDSILSCAVACVRWRGYKVDIDGLLKLRKEAEEKKYKLVNGNKFEIPTVADKARIYVEELMTDTERKASKIQESTKKTLLEAVSKWVQDCSCLKIGDSGSVAVDQTLSYEQMIAMVEAQDKAEPDPNCKCCSGTGKVKHPAAFRAEEVLKARESDKEIETIDKLLLAGRFHASFKVIGTLSSRMSGTDGLNAQGIKSDYTVRSKFPLAFGGLILCGGDFSGFEVTLAEACYNDPDLRRDLLTCEGCEGEMECIDGDFICKTCKSQTPCGKCNGKGCKKCGDSGIVKVEGKAIHALFGVHVFPDMTYKQIKATKGTADDRYTRCKQAVFAMFYGGEGFTLQSRLGVDIDTANEAYTKFITKYKRVGVERQKIFDKFCSMRQPGGLGTAVVWHDPEDKIESMFGFARYFTLENRICRALFDLAQDPPREWRDIKIKVQRRDREQTAGGAVQSALYGAAFQLQSANMRAAANHVIQSSGAQVTKAVQRKIWEVQPTGASRWIVQPCNIHDEILCPTSPETVPVVAKVVREAVESYRPKVPLIKMEWKVGLGSWAEKG